MNGFTTIPCPKCSTPVHVAQAVGMGFCPGCHTQVSAKGGSAAPGVVMPNVRIPRAPSRAGIFAGAIGAVVLGVGFTVFKMFLHGAIPGVGSGTAPGNVALKELGIEEKTADPDKMISSVRARAKQWKPDAEFYSINVLGMGPSGMVDLSDQASVVTVEYFSPSAVGSASPTDRQNALLKFTFNSYGMNQEAWGVRERSEHVPATPVPRCAAKQIGQVLSQKGLTQGKTAHVDLDPQFAFATDKLTFNVLADDPKLHLFLDINTCAIAKELK